MNKKMSVVSILLTLTTILVLYTNCLAAEAVNVALGKEATGAMNDTYNENLTDGVTDTGFAEIVAGKTVVIDLAEEYSVEKVVVYGRPNFAGQSKNVKIYLSKTPSTDVTNDVLIGTSPADGISEPFVIVTDEDVRAVNYRYIKTRCGAYSTLNEVEVYAKQEPVLVSNENLDVSSGSAPAYSCTITNTLFDEADVFIALRTSVDGKKDELWIDKITLDRRASQEYSTTLTNAVPADTSTYDIKAYVFSGFEELYLYNKLSGSFASEENIAKDAVVLNYNNNSIELSGIRTGSRNNKMLAAITYPNSDKEVRYVSDTVDIEEIRSQVFDIVSCPLSADGKYAANTFFSEADVNGNGGYYGVSVGISGLGGSIEVSEIFKQSKVYFVDKTEETAIIDSFKNVAVGGLDILLNQYNDPAGKKILDIDLTLPVYADNKSGIEGLFISITGEDGLGTVGQIEENFQKAIAMFTANQETITKERLLVYVDVLQLPKNAFFTGDVQSMVADELEAKKQTIEGNVYSSLTQLRTAFADSLLINAINTSSRESLSDVVEFYTELGLDYEDYNKLEVNKSLVNKNFTSVNAFKEAFEKSKAALDEPSPSKPSNSGGNNGGKDTYRIPSKAEPQQEINKSEKPNDAVVTLFTDIEQVPWAQDAVNWLAAKGVAGRGDGKFCPNDFITREEGIKLIMQAFEIKPNAGENVFIDVENDKWYAPYVLTAYKNNIVNGKGDNLFGIGEQLSREDFAVIIFRLSKTDLTNALASNFADNADISSYAKDAVAALSSEGVINGFEDGTFRPKKSVTRAEAAKMLYMIAGRGVSNETKE